MKDQISKVSQNTVECRCQKNFTGSQLLKQEGVTHHTEVYKRILHRTVKHLEIHTWHKFVAVQSTAGDERANVDSVTSWVVACIVGTAT